MPGSFPQGKDYMCQVLKTLPIKTGLDIGPGVGTYSVVLQHYRVDLDVFDAVEVWEPYVDKYNLRIMYSNVHVADARSWENWDYDIVFFGDVLEHMTKEEAIDMWTRASKQAKYAVISIPIVHMPQGEEEGNPYEEHVKDDWSVEEVLETFPHIKRYQKYSALGVFIADFSYDGAPQEDFNMEAVFPDNKDKAGGTENMVRRFRDEIMFDLPRLRDYRCLVIPGGIPSVEALYDGTPTIIWIHILPNQMTEDAANVLRDPAFQKNVVFMITVSEWHKNCLIRDLGMDPAKMVVIQNAVDPIPSDFSRFENVEKPVLIHASSADRAMEVLIPAAHRVDLDFELKIFNNFNPDTAPIVRDIEHIVLDERFTYYHTTPHKTVLRYMSEAHIHAYPAYWMETSCITQIEALVAGTLTVVSDRAALPETTMGNGLVVPFTGDRDRDIAIYADALANAIKLVKSGNWEPQDQSEQVYNFFSWERARERWLEFHERI